MTEVLGWRRLGADFLGGGRTDQAAGGDEVEQMTVGGHNRRFRNGLGGEEAMRWGNGYETPELRTIGVGPKRTTGCDGIQEGTSPEVAPSPSLCLQGVQAGIAIQREMSQIRMLPDSLAW